MIPWSAVVHESMVSDCLSGRSTSREAVHTPSERKMRNGGGGREEDRSITKSEKEREREEIIFLWSKERRLLSFTYRPSTTRLLTLSVFSHNVCSRLSFSHFLSRLWIAFLLRYFLSDRFLLQSPRVLRFAGLFSPCFIPCAFHRFDYPSFASLISAQTLLDTRVPVTAVAPHDCSLSR